MEPRIPNGATCLFEPPGSPPYGDGILLVAHPAVPADSAIGGPFAVEKVECTRRRHGSARIKLRSINRAYPPIVVDTMSDDDVRIIPELVRVLVPLRGR